MSWERSTLLFDAQTSGGLFMSVPENKLELLISELKRKGVSTAAVIGEVVDEHPEKIEILD